MVHFLINREHDQEPEQKSAENKHLRFGIFNPTFTTYGLEKWPFTMTKYHTDLVVGAAIIF
jgi:hypothetical protein